MGPTGEADFWFGEAGLGDVPRLSDPTGALYRTVGLGRLAATALANPSLWVRGVQCAIVEGRGFGVQSPAGIRQLPGVFLIHRGEVLRAYRHTSPADRPDYLALCAPAAGG